MCCTHQRNRRADEATQCAAQKPLKILLADTEITKITPELKYKAVRRNKKNNTGRRKEHNRMVMTFMLDLIVSLSSLKLCADMLLHRVKGLAISQWGQGETCRANIYSPWTDKLLSKMLLTVFATCK